MINLILFPSYGRDPQTKEELIKDWENGKDYRAYGAGFYCSIRDKVALSEQFVTVQLATHDRFIYVRVI